MNDKKHALEAYNTLKKYCTGQEDCSDCLLAVSPDGIHPDFCLMHLGEIPSQWQSLELE